MSDPQNRDIRITARPETRPEMHPEMHPDTAAAETRRGRNIIAVVGIDKYQNLQLLNNAVSDAQGVRALFIDQLGFQEVAPPLYDEAATRQAITALVVDRLNNQLEPDDSLVFFLAGHGYTETRTIGTRQQQRGYLIPVEGAHPDQRKFSTYLRLDAFLEEVAALPAMHILLILDACHSGFALGESVQVLRDVQRYSDDLSKRMSRRVIASAMSDQPALDNGPVIGHSLFTGTVVEALAQGKADEDNKGFVTSSEIALYVQRKVASWSNSQQTPDFGTFELDDRGELVISLVGETQSRLLAQEALAVAQMIMELGWHIGDPQRFRFAAKQYREALRHALLGKIELRAAELGLGHALLAAGDTAAVIEHLTAFVANTESEAHADAHLHLGLAHAKARDFTPAAKHLATWRKTNAKHENAAWIKAYIAWLRDAAEHPRGRQRALLIGINHYQAEIATPLRGCVNDVTLLAKPLLQQHFDFHADDIILLTDEAANRADILAAFAKLTAASAPGDAVLIYYSGHSVPPGDEGSPSDDRRQPFWILHDTQQSNGKLTNGIAALELHDLVMAIPATHKTVILDTHANWSLVSHAQNDGGYNLLVASDSGELAYESRIEFNGKQHTCGMLSMALYQALADLPDTPAISYDAWVNRATQLSEQASVAAGHERQTPLFIGERHQPVFGRFDPYLFAYEFAQQRTWADASPAQLLGRYNRLRAAIHAPFPAAHYAFGRAFIEQGMASHAHDAFATAQAQSEGGNPLLLRMLAASAATAGDLAGARQYLTDYQTTLPADQQTISAEMLTRLDAILAQPKRVLLVLRGVGGQAARTKLKPRLSALEKTLKQQLGAGGYRLDTRHFDEATQEQFRAELATIIDELDGQPLLLCVLGGVKWILGDLMDVQWATLGPKGNILLWTQADILLPAERKTISVVESSLLLLQQTLAATDLAHSTNTDFIATLAAAIANHQQGRHQLPTPLLRALHATYPFLGNHCPPALIAEMQAVGETTLEEIADFLQHEVDKRQARDDLWPEGRLQLGITHAARHDYAAARRTLDEVIRICESGGKFMEQAFMAA